MLSYLDRIIFPDRCEVIEVIPAQRYVYPIFKNGKSGLYGTADKNKWRIRLNTQITKINNIDVIIRNPNDRLISGINTFVQFTLENNPTLDYQTVVWFAKNYLYLNRHYCPQFLWLVNLARYLNPNAKLNFLSMAALDLLVGINVKPDSIRPVPADLILQIGHLVDNTMNQRIDMVIFDCIGKEMTFKELIQHIKNIDNEAYQWVVGYAQQILNVCIVQD
jgi:hypothetical protein